MLDAVGKQVAKARDGEPDGRRVRSISTRISILLAAERLFAEHGTANVSLKEIGAAAGQKNNGSVKYHFTDKDNLIRQIRLYRGKAIEENRARLFAEIVFNKPAPQVRDFISAAVGAFLTCFEEDNHFLGFWSRLVVEQHEVPGLFDGVMSASTLTVLLAMMRQLLPCLTDDVLRERWDILMVTAIHRLSRYHYELKANTQTAPLEEKLEDLISFLSAGFAAPYLLNGVLRSAAS